MVPGLTEPSLLAGPLYTGASTELPTGIWGLMVLPGVPSASISWYLWSCLLLPNQPRVAQSPN